MQGRHHAKALLLGLITGKTAQIRRASARIWLAAIPGQIVDLIL
jgi:hypothetical protein